MDTEKSVRSNIKIYRKIMAGGGFGDIGRNTAAYESRLREMYSSPDFQKYNYLSFLFS